MIRNIFLLLLFLTINGFSQENITSLLPDPFILPGMQASGEPEVYEGDFLFDLINGGADVYLEYGFVRVVTQSYRGMKGNSALKVEIYEFSNTDGAFGILSLSATQKPMQEKKGVFAVAGQGYMMMNKGPYFIMLSYSNLPDDLREGLVNKVSKDITSKIKAFANFPSMLTDNPSPCPGSGRSLYFHGNIALRNATYLKFKIPFEYKYGVFYRCDVLDYMIFKPVNASADHGQKLVEAILNTNELFNSEQIESGFTIKENNRLHYDIKTERDQVILIKYM